MHDARQGILQSVHAACPSHVVWGKIQGIFDQCLLAKTAK